MAALVPLALSVLNRLMARADVALVRSSTSRSGNGAPPHVATAMIDRAAPEDDHDLLHSLRGQRLSMMPAGAKVVLSAGCAGRWYFDWLDEAYPGIECHIGLEAYLPRPSDLPERIRWIGASVRNMAGVDEHSVDLVLCGQNIEHLWAADLVGFLLQSRRVLRPGGWLVVDSPNGWICDALNYLMPEHVAELTVEEVTRLLALAGFCEISIQGIWLCFDRDGQLLLPMAPNRVLAGWTVARRVAAATRRPEDSFVWWAEARATEEPDVPSLVALANRVVGERYRHRLANPTSPVGRLVGRRDRRWASLDRGQAGVLLRGPRAPLPPGQHRLGFDLRCSSAPPDAVVARVDAFSASSGAVLASREVRAGDLSVERFTRIELPLTLDVVAFGVEFRLESTGVAGLTAALVVDVGLAPSVPFAAEEYDRR